MDKEIRLESYIDEGKNISDEKSEQKQLYYEDIIEIDPLNYTFEFGLNLYSFLNPHPTKVIQNIINSASVNSKRWFNEFIHTVSIHWDILKEKIYRRFTSVSGLNLYRSGITSGVLLKAAVIS